MAVELQPKRPPGRVDRKAARYAAEITRLRSAGYTYEAIREALADVGLTVSTSALRREVRRMRQRSPQPPPLHQRTPVAPAQAASLPRAPPTSPTPPSAQGAPAAPVVEHTRAAADAFFTANPSHLLHPHKETP